MAAVDWVLKAPEIEIGVEMPEMYERPGLFG
jgi:hypothetical protein